MAEYPHSKEKLVISASRRTDIPSFFADWFFARLETGAVEVTNPFNRRQVREIRLTPDSVACFVFWTRDARPMLSRLPCLTKYYYYFHVTINGYGPPLEPAGPDVEEALKSLELLAATIGPERVIWRYDPIILAGSFDAAWHVRTFRYLASRCAGLVRHCVTSVYDAYHHTEVRLRGLGLKPEPSNTAHMLLLRAIADCARDFGIPLSLCAEPELAASLDIQADTIPACIDGAIIASLAEGFSQCTRARDRNQRPGCRCIKSVDIGTYHTCPRGCSYCYANRARRSMHA